MVLDQHLTNAPVAPHPPPGRSPFARGCPVGGRGCCDAPARAVTTGPGHIFEEGSLGMAANMGTLDIDILVRTSRDETPDEIARVKIPVHATLKDNGDIAATIPGYRWRMAWAFTRLAWSVLTFTERDAEVAGVG